MPRPEMSDPELAQMLRQAATLSESGDCGKVFAEYGVDRLRAKADLLDPPPIKAGDTVTVQDESESFTVEHIRYEAAWVVPVSRPGSSGQLRPLDQLTIVKRS